MTSFYVIKYENVFDVFYYIYYITADFSAKTQIYLSFLNLIYILERFP